MVLYMGQTWKEKGYNCYWEQRIKTLVTIGIRGTRYFGCYEWLVIGIVVVVVVIKKLLLVLWLLLQKNCCYFEQEEEK